MGNTLAQDVAIHCIAPVAELRKDPLPGAVSMMSLGEALREHAAGGVKLPEVSRG